MLNNIQILLFSAIHTFPDTVLHSVLLQQSQWRKPPKWTPESLLKSRTDRRQGDVQRTAMDQTPWLCVWSNITVQRVVHLPKLQQHSSGDIPSENKETNPAIPARLALLCISDHRVMAVTLITILGYWHPQFTNPTALWQSQSCCFPPLQRTVTYLQLSKRTVLRVLCENIIKY